jgi:hypothetical protein
MLFSWAFASALRMSHTAAASRTTAHIIHAAMAVDLAALRVWRMYLCSTVSLAPAMGIPEDGCVACQPGMLE